MSRLRIACVLGLAAALFGCSTSSNTPLDMLGPEYGHATCSVLRSCYGDTVITLLTGASSEAACEDRVSAQFDNGILPRYHAAIAMGRMTYDVSQSGACIDSIAAQGCGVVSARSTPACESLFVGNVASGGACAIDEECMGDAYCSTGSACPGTCQARVGSGATCTASSACQSGLVCASGACAAPGGAGASCDGSTGVQCAGGLICTGASGTTPGTCATTATVFALASGATCNAQMTQLCMAGLACTITGLTMQTCGPAGIAAGAACHPAFPDACQAGYYCGGTAVAMGDFDGTCAALPTAGMPCATVLAGATCADGNTCEAGMCVAINANGGACTTGTDCYGGQCNSGVCQTPSYCP